MTAPQAPKHLRRSDLRATAQLLTQAGYAVLRLNFRGSRGYGRSFQQAGARQWGGTMQDDVTDATRCCHVGVPATGEVLDVELTIERLDHPALIDRAATLLAQGKTLAWFRDGSEFGPRALGRRSISIDESADAVRIASARLGLPWQDMKFSSVHSKDAGDWVPGSPPNHGLYALLRDIRQHQDKVVVPSSAVSVTLELERRPNRSMVCTQSPSV